MIKNQFQDLLFSFCNMFLPKFFLLFYLFATFPNQSNGQTLTDNSFLQLHKYFLVPTLATAVMEVNNQSEQFKEKERQCLRTGRLLGIVSGSAMGVAHLYWRATGTSGVHGPMWKSVVAAVPSIIIGSWVGKKTTEWTTRQILKGEPSPAKAILKGAGYGALNGAVAFTSSLIPLLIIGHYMDVIHFNMDKDWIFLKIVGVSMLGGTVYGATIGATVGAVYGPCIAFYMKF